MKGVKIFTITIIFMVLLTISISAKTQKDDELRFQFGLGWNISTGNLLGIIESVQLYDAMTKGEDYNYPGLDEEEQEALQNLNGNMQRALLVANILGSLEYSLNARFLWNILISEVDITLLPFEGTYSGKLDLMVVPMVGVRAPWFIQPYVMAGVMFTFSFYPNEFTKIESWKGDWAATDNFCWRPGVNLRLGLDFKFKGFSVGAYAQYTVKDFQEFTSWWGTLVAAGMTSAEATGRIIASQCRIGIVMDYYLF
jgi:hypothetical protein